MSEVWQEVKKAIEESRRLIMGSIQINKRRHQSDEEASSKYSKRLNLSTTNDETGISSTDNGAQTIPSCSLNAHLEVQTDNSDVPTSSTSQASVSIPQVLGVGSSQAAAQNCTDLISDEVRRSRPECIGSNSGEDLAGQRAATQVTNIRSCRRGRSSAYDRGRLRATTVAQNALSGHNNNNDCNVSDSRESDGASSNALQFPPPEHGLFDFDDDILEIIDLSRDAQNQPVVDIIDLSDDVAAENTFSNANVPQEQSSLSTSQGAHIQCSICIDNINEPTAGACGHLFCADCIKQAIRAQRKCPLCKRWMPMKSLRRIYI